MFRSDTGATSPMSSIIAFLLSAPGLTLIELVSTCTSPTLCLCLSEDDVYVLLLLVSLLLLLEGLKFLL